MIKKRFPISLKFSIVFSFLFFAIVASLGFWGFYIGSRIIEKITLNDISVFAEDKSQRLMTALDYDFERVSLIASRKKLRQSLLGVKNIDISDDNILNMIKIIDNTKNSVASIVSIDIFNKEGLIAASTQKSDIGNAFRDSDLFKTIIEEGRYMSEFYLQAGILVRDVYEVLLDPDNGSDIIGIVGVKIDSRNVERIFRDYRGLGVSGETLLARIRGPELVSLMPLRHLEDAVYGYKLSLGSEPDLIEQFAVGDNIVLSIALDYRDKEVLAAYRYIPGRDWVVISKLDLDEAIVPISSLKSQLILLSLALLVIGISMILFFSKRLTGHIRFLQYGTDRIAEGDFDHDIKLGSNDEISELAVSFNRMAKTIKNNTISIFELNKEIEKREEIENKFKAVVENVGVGIAVISPDMEVLSLNRQMREWFPEADPSKKPFCYKVFNSASKERPCDYCPTSKTLEDGQIHEITTKVSLSDREFNFKIVSSAIKDKEGNIIAAIDVVDDISTELEIRKKLEIQTADLNERVKELSCLYKISDIIEDYGNSVNEIYGNAVKVIAQGMRYADYTCVRITIDGNEYKTDNFQETELRLSRDIVVLEKVVGAIDIFLLKDFSDPGQELFLKEEINMVNAIADRLGRVTERKIYEKNIKESENKYRALFEDSKDAIMIVAPENGFIDCNPSTCNIFGVESKKEFLNFHPADFSPQFQPDGRNSQDAANEMMKIAMDKGAHFFEWVHKKKNGEDFFATVSLVRLDIENRSVLQATVRDITESKIANDAIREAKEYVERLFDFTPSAIYTVDKNKAITSWNKKAEEITGYSEDEILGKPCTFFAQDPYQDKRGLYSDDIEKPVINKECTIRTKDGQIKIISKNADILRDKKGDILGGIESFTDITEQKKIDQIIKESEEKFRTLVSNIPGVVYRCGNDENWTMSYISNEILGLSGYPAVDFIENKIRSFTSIVYPEDRERVAVTIQRALEKRETYVIEYKIIHKDGYLKWIYEKGQGIFDKENRLLWLDGVIFDITERKEAEKIKDEFLSTVSHELRTPLSITKEGVNLMLDQIPGKINKEQSSILKTAKENINRLAKIIDDLLDISKMEAKKLELDRKEIDAALLIDKVFEFFKNAAAKRNINLNFKRLDSSIMILVDEDKIIQVFNNLIGNALKFTEIGKIEITLNDIGNEVECAVSDTGRGISKEDLPKIFNRFQQFSRASGPGIKGTGLGLAISKNIVEMHGGNIWVESEPGKGTKFTFTLPKTEVK
jgi:PAS domain S-box-containing protein